MSEAKLSMELAEAASMAASPDRGEEQERRLGLRWRKAVGGSAPPSAARGLQLDEERARAGEELSSTRRSQVEDRGHSAGREGAAPPSSTSSTTLTSWFSRGRPKLQPAQLKEESPMASPPVVETRSVADVKGESGAGALEFDVIVYGASGVTGRRIVAEFLREGAGLSPPLRVAAAGRSEERVRAALDAEGLPADSIPVVVAGNGVAESSRAASLRRMAGRCRLVLNAAGPYRDSGDAVVKACVECGTDYVDVTGEPLFIERTLLRHGARAVQTGSRVVNCCGFDSVPADLGVARCEAEFAAAGALLCEVESFLTVSGGGAKVRANSTTFECAVRGVSDMASLVDARRSIEEAGLMPRGVQPLGKRQKVQDFMYSDVLAKNAAKFMGSDAAVVRRSVRARSEDSQRPCVQYAAYMTLPDLWAVFLYSFYGTIVASLAKLGPPFRALMIRFPGWFTGGLFSKSGPTTGYLEKGSFEMRFLCRGISMDALNAGRIEERDVLMDCRVAGPEAGYVATPIMAVACATGLLRDTGCTFRGGVATPSLGLSGILDPFWARVGRRGIRFEVLSPLRKEAA